MFQVRKKDTGQIYAMKVMRKDRILAKDHGDYVRTEREVLTAVFHPYIVTLRCSFQVACPSSSLFCLSFLFRDWPSPVLNAFIELCCHAVV